MERVSIDVVVVFHVAMYSASIREIGARVRPRTTSRNKSRALRAHWVSDSSHDVFTLRCTREILLTKCSLHPNTCP